MTTTAPPALTQRDAQKPTLSELADQAKPDRNRAVDLYRALAMTAVALGHWAAVALTVNAKGEVIGGNALELAPQMSWITWLFQVMPLFFVVGGFSSAMSLDAHFRAEGLPQDWVAARLRRMLAPTVVLALSWIAILVAGTMAGVGELVAAGALAAAIPLWFLANYTIDTAIAPYLLPAFRRNPGLIAGGGLSVFLALEVARFAGVPYLPHLNWVLGWLLFQVAGFAWRDGLLPTGRALLATAAGLWTAALLAITIGPYPVSMVNVPGLEHSPANPPTLALLLFGSAYSATALYGAPFVNRWLAVHKRSWAAVVAANTVAMSVYLWHMTAASAAGAALYMLGGLPTATVGTSQWWLQKLPLIGLSFIILVGIVALVAKYERRALLAPRVAWQGGQCSMLAVAALVSISLKLWVIGSIAGVAAGTAGLAIVWFGSLSAKRTPTEQGAGSDLSSISK